MRLTDRATVVTNAVLQIIADAELELNLEPGELQYRIWRRLLEEFDDIARQFADEATVKIHKDCLP